MNKSSCLLSLLLICTQCTPHQDVVPPVRTLPQVPPQEAPQKKVTSTEEETFPPPSSETRPTSFPAVVRSTLPNGLVVDSLSLHSLPMVTVRLVVAVGTGYGKAGVAQLTADLLEEGGTRTMNSSMLAERVESLGTQLSISTGFDSTVLALSVTREHVEEAVALLSEIARTPRFDKKAFLKRQALALDEAAERTRSDSTWMAGRLLAREMFPKNSLYAHALSPTPHEVQEIERQDLKDFYKQFYVPKNSTLVVAGDIDAEMADALARKHFGSWRGASPLQWKKQAIKQPPAAHKILVAHRPQSAQSTLVLSAFVPDRLQPNFAAASVAVGILGGSPASRLFLDVREQKSLAYRVGASIVDLAYAPGVLTVHAGTQTEKTEATLEALLDNLKMLSTQPLHREELDSTRQYLSGTLSLGMETVGAMASMVGRMHTFRLPDGYWDSYRNELLQVELSQVSEQASTLLKPERCWIAVTGDATVLAEPLARFGEVTVFDPEHGYKVLRVIEPKSTFPAVASAGSKPLSSALQSAKSASPTGKHEACGSASCHNGTHAAGCPCASVAECACDRAVSTESVSKESSVLVSPRAEDKGKGSATIPTVQAASSPPVAPPKGHEGVRK